MNKIPLYALLLVCISSINAMYYNPENTRQLQILYNNALESKPFQIHKAEQLIIEGADPNVVGQCNSVLLDGAIAYPNSFFTLLLQYGANPNGFLTQRTYIGPLHRAVLKGQHNRVRELLRYGANIHQKDYRGDTPLMYAIYANESEEVTLLLKNGAVLDIQTPNHHGETPMYMALARGYEDPIKLLELYKSLSENYLFP